MRAPKWQLNLGVDYKLPVGNGLAVLLSNHNSYTSKYLTGLGRLPDLYQNGFVKSDISLALEGRDERWSIAVIGKNITNKLTSGACAPSNLQGGNLGGQITGGTTKGAAGVDEVACYMDPGRQLWLRLTVKLAR